MGACVRARNVSRKNLSRNEGLDTTDSYPGKEFHGWIGYISPTAEFTPKNVETTQLRSSLVYEVRVFVNDPKDELRLGMPATVRLPLPAETPK